MVRKYKTRRGPQRGGVRERTDPRTQSGTINGYSYATAEHAGYKEYDRAGRAVKYNEDRSVVAPLGTNGLLVIVCDGHGGYQIADMVSKELPKLISVGLNTDDALSDNSFIGEKLKAAFNAMAVKIQALGYLAASQGTTCTAVVVTPTSIVTAYLGDSPAVVMKKDETLVGATKDHDFENQEELQRLNSIYQSLSDYQKMSIGVPVKKDQQGVKRLMGGLAMSRSLGDLQYAVYLSTVPDLVVVKREPSMRLVVGSDSFTEDYLYRENYNRVRRPYAIRNVLGPADIVKEVTPTLNETELSLEDRVKKITINRMDKFYYPGQGYQNDNTTLVVVELPDPPVPASAGVNAPAANTAVPTMFEMPRGIHVGGKKKKRTTRKKGKKRQQVRRH